VPKDRFNGIIKEAVPFAILANTKDRTMKLTTIALAAAFAVSSTYALANPVHHKSHVRSEMGQYHRPDSNYGNPNGTEGGPITLSGTDNSQFGGSTAGTTGHN
jgi:hypothetical protein